MDIGRFFKSIVNTKTTGEEIVKKQVEIYYQYKGKYPDKEPHDWLANTYLSRRATQGENINDPDLQMVACTETFLCACLPEPDCIRALGLYILYKERPDIIGEHPKFSEEYEKLIGSIVKLQGKNPKELEKLYKKYNPKKGEELKRELIEKSTPL